MIVIINGAPGAGKTKTAQFLFESTDKSAFVDGDWLLAINPEDRKEKRHLRYKNIAAITRNYYEDGFTNIFISFVYTRPEDLSEQINLLKDLDQVLVFALIPNDEALRKRHAEDTYKREEIESSVELNNKINELENIEKIDNSNLPIEEVARIIKDKINIASNK
jgi:adenylate kinase family enzyme